jgi:glucokinase
VRRAGTRRGYLGSALAARAADPAALDGPDIAAAFAAGDPFTVAAVIEAVRYLGQALAAIHLDTGVERIILMGGFAGALGEPYRRLVVEAARDACWDLGQDWDAMVRLGAADDDSALLGAGFRAAGLLDELMTCG